MRLIHTGSVIVDQVMRIRQLPAPGGDVVVSASYSTAGGAMNSLVAAARDGMEVLYCGLVGTGVNASIIAKALADAGIRENYARLADADNGFCVALVEDSGERTFITSIGVEGRFGAEHLEAIEVRSGDVVYVSGYSLATPENARGLAEWMPRVPRSATVFVDPSPLVSEWLIELFRPLFARCDILSANRAEAVAIVERCGGGFGGAGGGDAGGGGLGGGASGFACDELARELCGVLPAGAWAVVRDGARATWICRNDGGRAEDDRTEVGRAQAVPTFPVVPVDTSGCGDVHAGVLLAGLSRGLGMAEAVTRANAAAALKATREGPNTAPTTSEIEDFLRAHS